MRPKLLTMRAAAGTVAFSVAVALSTGLAQAQSSPAGSASAQGVANQGIKLVAAQKSINVPLQGKFVFLDPGVYVEAYGAPLRFDVQRASYASPITITRVLGVPGGQPVYQPLPRWAADGWIGLRRFLRTTIYNSHGKVAFSSVTSFCPNGYNAQRANPNAPANDPYPFGCFTNPFEKGMVFGIQRGWGVDPYGCCGFNGPPPRLRLGKYILKVNVTEMWRRMLHLSLRDATVIVHLKVVPANKCPYPCGARRRSGHASGTLPKLPQVPIMTNPPASDLPDLIPLPSYGIAVQNIRATKKQPASSWLAFGATVWIGGNARLDVEGFRVNGSPIMAAWQYFWHNGRVVGRARAGTMGFDAKPGHNHWHFQQFAEYRLLNGRKSIAVRSRKVGFCIAPTDAINMLLPAAQWQLSYTGFGGACGSPSALWVQEALPVGWGDTYYQYVAGQSFDITHLPNGTYYIEVIANPEKVLYETNLSNDVSLRKVILGGTPGHRTVKVPPYFYIHAS